MAKNNKNQINNASNDTINIKNKKQDYARFKKMYDEAALNYKDTIDLSYKQIGANEGKKRLANSNNAYVSALLTGCFSELYKNKENADLTEIIAMFVNYNNIKKSSKFDDSVTRYLSEMYENAAASCDEKHKGIMGLFGNKLDDALKNMCKSQNVSIKKHIEQDDFDMVFMLPTQAAMHKIRFTEQCYIDMRNCKNESEVRECLANYKIGCQHLANIAENSGFSMNELTSLERYYVGCMIDENPEKATMFNEMFDMNVELDKNREFDDDQWTGRFVTADGHEYTNDGRKNEDECLGAFTPRMPVTIGNTNYVDVFKDRCQEFNAVLDYLDSKECEIPKNKRNTVKSMVEDRIDKYWDSMCSSFIDDGIPRAEFDKIRKEADKAVREDMNENTNSQAFYDAIYAETLYRGNRMMFEKVDIDHTKGIEYAKEVISGAYEQQCHARNEQSDLSASEVVTKYRNDMFADMSPRQLSTFLIGCIDNVHEGIYKRGKPGRDDYSLADLGTSEPVNDDIKPVKSINDRPNTTKRNVKAPTVDTGHDDIEDSYDD